MATQEAVGCAGAGLWSRNTRRSKRIRAASDAPADRLQAMTVRLPAAFKALLEKAAAGVGSDAGPYVCELLKRIEDQILRDSQLTVRTESD